LFAGLFGSLDPWAARDAYVDVVLGLETADAFARRWLSGARSGRRSGAPAAPDVATLLALMAAQRWRLAMFSSDGWYWDDPMRPETAAVLRAAARAVRIVDGLADAGLERRLVADLALFSSPGHRIDGATIYGRALAAVGQPGVEDPA
jgi:hypothetical protein